MRVTCSASSPRRAPRSARRSSRRWVGSGACSSAANAGCSCTSSASSASISGSRCWTPAGSSAFALSEWRRSPPRAQAREYRRHQMHPRLRRPHLLPWLTLAGILAASSAGAQSSQAATEQELRDAVNKYVAGYASNTVEGYFANYANDITYWWPNGLRQQREAYHKTWTDTLAGGNTVVSAVAEDVLVHAAPAGDAGVASFMWKISRKNGAPYDLQTSTTWFKRAGKWQIVHMHFNRVAPPGGRGPQPQGAGA